MSRQANRFIVWLLDYHTKYENNSNQVKNITFSRKGAKQKQGAKTTAGFKSWRSLLPGVPIAIGIA
jgi:hypothetical protein